MNFIQNLQNLINDKTIIDTNARINWEEYFFSLTLLTSIRSSCKRLHVGCVLVKNNRVLSTGYNGFIKGLPHISVIRNNHEQCTVHAEQNAITDAALRGVSLDNCTAYITHFPCINCAKLLLSVNVKKIHYIYDYKNDNVVYELLKQAGIECVKY